MIYEHFYDPVAHMIVKDFFTEDEYHEVMNVIVPNLEPLMHHGEYVNVTTNTFSVSPIVKVNKNIWTHNSDSPYAKQLNDLMRDKIWNSDFQREILNNRDGLFQYYHRSNRITTMLSKYDEGGFYDWHSDKARSLTCSVVLSDGNVQGGDFCLKSVSGNIKVIPFMNNSAIMFPSECTHKVTKILQGASRISVQLFTLYTPEEPT